jgi:hypothetical protein
MVRCKTAAGPSAYQTRTLSSKVGIVRQQYDIAGKKGAVHATQIEQHPVTTGNRNHARFCDTRRTIDPTP